MFMAWPQPELNPLTCGGLGLMPCFFFVNNSRTKRWISTKLKYLGFEHFYTFPVNFVTLTSLICGLWPSSQDHVSQNRDSVTFILSALLPFRH